MAAPTEAQLAHIELLESLDTHGTHKNFRNPHWKPTAKRNKTLKAILGDIQKKEAAALAVSQEASAAASDNEHDGLSTSGETTPNRGPGGGEPDLAAASSGLAKMVLARNAASAGAAAAAAANGSSVVASYTNIESAPSWEHSKKYCDVTGLPAPYVDPKTRMRYHNKEVFSLIRALPQGVGEMYLEARNAHTVLK